MEEPRPMPSISKAFAAYACAVILCFCLLILTLQLWKADPVVPIAYSGDALPVQLWIKGIVENGWYLHNDAVGAPAGHDMNDYPMMDGFNFLLLKALSLFSSSVGKIYNLFFLLTFPLTTLSSLFVLRRFALPYAVSIVVSLLYTFLPFHFLNGLEGHLFLASYFLLPLVVMLILWIYLDEPFLFQRQPDRCLPKLLLLNWKSLLAVLVCLLLSSSGAYYAYFACFLLLVAGVLSSCHRKTFAPVSAALLLIAVVGLGGAANALSSLVFRLNHGANPQAVQRDFKGVEFYSLKLTELLLPTSVHRIHWLAKYRHKYANRSPIATSDSDYLGVIGAFGFVATICWLCNRDPNRSRSELRTGLGACVLAALLLATVGGLGSMFAFVIGYWIRCYDRVTVYIAYFSLIAVALLLTEMAMKYVKTGISRLFYYGFLATVLVLGVLDQTSPRLISSYACLRDEYHNDRDFISRVEVAVPERALILQLPYVPFPEAPPVHRMTDYAHLRPYLHSKTLRWSYGAMRGREGDAWQCWISSQPVEQMVKVLAESGFAGIYLDRFGFTDQGTALESKLAHVLDVRPIVSKNQRLSFFSLAEYNQQAPQALAKRQSAR